MEHAEINRIQEQFVGGQWPKFLQSVSIDGLRNWTKEEVSFNFPITAIVGENGSGKSTLLKAAACAYDGDGHTTTFYPTSFFQNTPWEVVSDVRLEYKFQHGNTLRDYSISKSSARWSYPKNKARRNVYFLDISRTLPIDATIGYGRIAKLGQSEIRTTQIDDTHREMLSYILGRDYNSARFAVSDVDENREVGLLQFGGTEISQFHQGAGEDATLDLVKNLQSVPDTSLILIDEIENSLHPKAQRRLIRKFLALSRQKRLQIIVSTHSPYILQELPLQARVLLARNSGEVNAIYNVSTEFAMSQVDEEVHPELYVLVEDKEARDLLREILTNSNPDREVLQRIQILPAGAANVLKSIGPNLANDKLPFKGVCFVDADETGFSGCKVLPGDNAPEVDVFQGLKKLNWANLDTDFQHGSGELFAWLDECTLEPDHHRWTAIIGDKLRLSKEIVWNTMCKSWVKNVLEPSEQQRVVDQINSEINRSSSLFSLSQ